MIAEKHLENLENHMRCLIQPILVVFFFSYKKDTFELSQLSYTREYGLPSSQMCINKTWFIVFIKIKLNKTLNSMFENIIWWHEFHSENYYFLLFFYNNLFITLSAILNYRNICVRVSKIIEEILYLVPIQWW